MAWHCCREQRKGSQQRGGHTSVVRFLRGVRRAPTGTTIRVASTRVVGHTFQEKRTPCTHVFHTNKSCNILNVTSNSCLEALQIGGKIIIALEDREQMNIYILKQEQLRDQDIVGNTSSKEELYQMGVTKYTLAKIQSNNKKRFKQCQYTIDKEYSFSITELMTTKTKNERHMVTNTVPHQIPGFQ